MIYPMFSANRVSILRICTLYAFHYFSMFCVTGIFEMVSSHPSPLQYPPLPLPLPLLNSSGITHIFFFSSSVLLCWYQCLSFCSYGHLLVSLASHLFLLLIFGFIFIIFCFFVLSLSVVIQTKNPMQYYLVLVNILCKLQTSCIEVKAGMFMDQFDK